MSARVRRYIRSGLFRIPGWLQPVDAALFAAILLHQRSDQLAGGLAEIGVYFGRSFVLMAQTLGPGERAFAADLFEQGPWVPSQPLQLREFRRHLQRFGVPADAVCAVVGRSEKLRPADVWDAVGSVRFFSVDGGHELAPVTHDLNLARGTLAPHGVLAIDDAFNSEWPEVTVATIDWLRANQDYLPFAATQGKLYVCRSDWHYRYLSLIAKSDWLAGFSRRRITLIDTPLLWCHQPIASRIIHRGLARLGLGSAAASVLSLL
jgi:hypothetical protein